MARRFLKVVRLRKLALLDEWRRLYMLLGATPARSPTAVRRAAQARRGRSR